MARPPPVDERAIEVDAPPERAWAALGEVLPGAFGTARSSRLAAALGCRDRTARGNPLEVGATLPGFRVVRAEQPSELALEGQHRFARYALVFRINPVGGGRCRVRGATAAEFPGAHGALYRLAVIGTRGHALVVRRLLRAVAGAAERGRRSDQDA